MGYVFISYSSKRSEAADTMREILNKNGIDTWMAPYSIPAGGDYATMITRGIRNCDCFLLLLSEEAQASAGVYHEVDIASMIYKKPIVPVLLEDLELNDAFTFYIRSKQIVTVRELKEDTSEMTRVLNDIKAYIQSSSSVNDDEKTLVCDRYLLKNKIGYGGSGSVYRAIDTKDSNKEVVVKITGGVDKDIISKQLRVHKKIAEIDNDNVCKIIDIAMCENNLYIVMNYLSDATPLSDYNSFLDVPAIASRKGPLYPLALNMYRDFLLGVKELHNREIIHADLAPNNIIVSGSSLRIIDFNSSFFHGDIIDPQRTLTIYGYMSPELASGQIDFRSDIFSAGMIGFQWIAGELPYNKTGGSHRFDKLRINNEIRDILCKAVELDPNKRYQTIDEFIDKINRHINSLDDPVEEIYQEPVFVEREAIKDAIAIQKTELSPQKTDNHLSPDVALSYYLSAADIPQTLTLPDKYSCIDSNIFSKLNLNGKEIRQIIIPDTVEEIDDNAFFGLIVTEAVFVPNSVKKIGHMAFPLKLGAYVYCEENSAAWKYCLQNGINVIIDKTFKSDSTVAAVALEELAGAKNATRLPYDTLATRAECVVDNIKIPEGVRVVDDYALYKAEVRNYILIPNSVIRMGTHAFKLLPQAYVVCEPNSYAYRFCRTNSIRNSVDIYRARKVCSFCGCRFTGLLKRTCPHCGKEKDY